MILSIQRLRVFKAVVDRGSLTGAARVLFYSQSAVSQHISALEQDLETALLMRRPRGVQLTSSGRLLYEHATSILQGVERAERELGALAGLEGGTLHVASFPTAGATLIPPAISLFQERYDAVSLRYSEMETDDSLIALSQGNVDLALVHDYTLAPLESDGTYGLDKIVEEPLLIGLNREHPLASRKRVRVADLVDVPWIGGNACSCRTIVFEIASRAGFEPRIVFQSDDYGTVQGLIAEGMGVALMPALATVNLRANVVAVPLEPSVGKRRIHAAYPSTDYTLPATRAMIGILAKEGPRALRRSVRK